MERVVRRRERERESMLGESLWVGNNHLGLEKTHSIHTRNNKTTINLRRLEFSLLSVGGDEVNGQTDPDRDEKEKSQNCHLRSLDVTS